MSLQVWLPLNGDTKNHGLLGELIVSSPTYVDGKLGKALYTGAIKMTAEQTAQVLNNDEVSICFWVYVNADTGSNNCVMLFGNAAMSENDNRKFSLFQYPTCNDFHWSWMNDAANTTFATNILSGVLPSYKWTHVAIVYKNPTIKIFINGELQYSETNKVSSSATFAYATQVVYNSIYHKFNDYRIYDSAISDREVKELAKGLFCHYPLSSNVGNNLISGMFECTSTKDEYASSGHITVHISPEEILANKGKTLCFSYRTNSKGASQSVGVDWGKTRFGIHGAINITTASGTSTNYPFAELLACSKEEGLYYTTWTIPTDMTANDGLGFVIQTRYTEGFAKPSSDNNETWWIKQVKLEWGDKPTFFCPNENDNEYSGMGYSSNIEYDTSGLGNHGTIEGSAAFSINKNSPRYDGCYHFGNLQYIQAPSPWGKSVDLEQFTITMWIKKDDENNGAYSTFFNSFGYGRDGLWLGMNVEGSGFLGFRGGVSPNYARSDNTLLATDTWYHVAYVFNQGYVTWYINGVKKDTTKYDGTSITIDSTFEIGNSRGDVTWNTHFAGSISDFRWYATVLSDTAIQQLYNSPISVTNTGVLMAQGEFKEV